MEDEQDERDEQKLELSDRRSEWLVEPQGSGIRVHVSGVAEADEMTPDVLRALLEGLDMIQKTGLARPKPPRECPELNSCQEYTGTCPHLVSCGTFK
jgi:hypothetical protein